MENNRTPEEYRGEIYLKNAALNRYLQVDDQDAPGYKTPGSKMEVFGFTGEKHQRWKIAGVDDELIPEQLHGAELYTITCVKSGMLLTKSGLYTIQSPAPAKGHKLDRQYLWYIERIEIDGKSYIHIRSCANRTLYLCAASALNDPDKDISRNGRDAVMHTLSNGSYRDEWEIVRPSRKLLIIVPGILGSTLYSTQGNCDAWLSFTHGRYDHLRLTEEGLSIEEDIASINKNNYGANNTYQDIYNAMQAAFPEYDVLFFDYDFRMSNDRSAEKLKKKIDDRKGQDVVLIAHSMGGLVVESMLANHREMNKKIRLIITLGTPFLGTAKCINAMRTGQMLQFPVVKVDIFEKLVKSICVNCASAYQLLPTTDYRKYTDAYPLIVCNGGKEEQTDNVSQILSHSKWGTKKDGTPKPVINEAAVFHESLKKNGKYVINMPAVAEKTVKIAGTGLKTIETVKLKKVKKHGQDEYAFIMDTDALTYSYKGDETVLAASAGIGKPDLQFEGVNHMQLVSDRKVLDTVKEIIALSEQDDYIKQLEKRKEEWKKI